MNRLFTFVLLLGALNGAAQARFSSRANGDWTNPDTWTRVRGNTPTNYPVAGDTVAITSGHAVTVPAQTGGVVPLQCAQLTVRGASSLTLSALQSNLFVSGSVLATEGSRLTVVNGLFTITGGLTLNGGSTLRTQGGATSVLGLVVVDAFLFSGETTVEAEGGVFSCAGGINLLGFVGLAELRIGQSLVNLYGLISANVINSTIRFAPAATGTLTLGGFIVLPSATNFVAGTGTVAYVGLPGVPNFQQVVAPFTYYNLVVAGIGSGVKTIGGPVRVQKSLTLLLDRLQVNAPGSLLLDNNVLITRVAGRLQGTPTLAGQVDVVYSNPAKDTTGTELPARPGALRNLTVTTLGGLQLAADVTVTNQLTLAAGPIITGPYTLRLTNPAGGPGGTDPAIERTAGYVEGRIARAIGPSPGTRRFPFGAGLLLGNRELALTFTAPPTVPGTLVVEHVNAAPGTTGLPLAEGPLTLSATAPFYWRAEATDGLSGGTYTVALTNEGLPAVTDVTQLRVLKRAAAAAPWALEGVAGPNTGSNLSPVVVREQLSGFAQLTTGYSSAPLPVTLVAFTGRERAGRVLLEWNTAQEQNSAYFEVEKQQPDGSFAALGRVQAAGTTTQPRRYSWADTAPARGLNYYRLRQVDVDGQQAYSPVVAVSLTPLAAGVFDLFPSPATTTLTLQTQDPGQAPWTIFNELGQSVGTLQVGPNDVSHLPAGVYVVRNHQQVRRFVKQ
jgi:hypothetical protein